MKLLNGKEIKFPTAEIESISNLGKVIVRFSKPMKVREEFKNMKKGGRISLGRLLNGDGDLSVSEIVDFKINAGSESEENELEFDWFVEDFTERQMEVQL